MDTFINWVLDLSNAKSLGLVIFFTTFVGIILYVYTGKERSKRLESYKNIPFLNDNDKVPAKTPQNKSGE